MTGQSKLFIGDKQKATTDATRIVVAFREIERWADQLQAGGGGGGITDITSLDGTVTVTNPTGPTVDLSAPGSGGGVPYASLTGPGFTTSPGDLTQAGGLTVNSTTHIALNDNSGTGIQLQESGAGPVNVIANSGGIVLVSYSSTGILIQNTTVSGANPGAVQLINAGTGGVAITDSGNGGIMIHETSAGSSGIVLDPRGGGGTGLLQFANLPTTNPGVGGAVWNSGGVLHIA